jgi:hypothetical protein
VPRHLDSLSVRRVSSSIGTIDIKMVNGSAELVNGIG